MNNNQKAQYNISDFVLKKYPDLVELLKASQSIEHDEKLYWFKALETMDEDQVGSLRQILEEEVKQLQEVDNNYNQQAQEKIDTAASEISEEEKREQEKIRKDKEMQSREQDQEKQDELLSLLNDL